MMEFTIVEIRREVSIMDAANVEEVWAWLNENSNADGFEIYDENGEDVTPDSDDES